ncbi:MAG TPA: helix-turn-helix transcriptional regulator [Steroidobacteraceae bacterium]|jgi:transcriptional regulator with XRE-family HTH domain|nr:helix-turn-helix transcriptional regulator [Steroidobacteraceae bacterium]
MQTINVHPTRPVGHLVREWRQHRRLSQLDLATHAEISARHLSFVESGRAKPSREMVLRLANHLDIPLRERNALLLAAGFAPAYAARPMEDASMTAASRLIEQLLRGFEPYPALTVDRHWQLLSSNQATMRLIDGVAPQLLQPPVNVLRLSLHPNGLAPRLRNLPEWRAHLLHRLQQQIEATQDPKLVALRSELESLPAPGGAVVEVQPTAIAVPMRLEVRGQILSMISTTTVFGSPVDITLSELALEAFVPADDQTAQALRQLADDWPKEPP